MKKVSYLVLFILFCVSFIIFNLIFSYTLDYIFLTLFKMSKYAIVPFIVKLASMLIAMNASIKLIFKYFYIERTSVNKTIKLMKIFIVLYSLIQVLIYGINDISSLYNMLIYFIFAFISISFVHEFIKGYAGKIV